MDSQLHALLRASGNGLAFRDCLEYLSKLIAEEDGNNGRRCLIRTKPVVIPGRCHRHPQQILILIDSLEHRDKEEEELCIILRAIARLKDIRALIGAERPVVMLSRTIHPCKWLLMKQTCKSMALSNLLHDLHRELISSLSRSCMYSETRVRSAPK